MNRRERRARARDSRLPSISTGQMFPAGTHLHDGHCERCTVRGTVPLATARLEPMGIESNMCAECLADFVAGAGVVPLGGGVYRVYVRTLAGSYLQVAVS